jgi:putative flippase GtrA
MKRFALFVGIGGISSLIQFLLLIIFVETKLLTEVAASAAGYLLSALFNYWANYHFTFKSTRSHSETFPRFVAAVGFGLLCNTLLFSIFLWLFNNYLPIPWVENYLVAQFMATGITVFINFAVQKIWIYRNH